MYSNAPRPNIAPRAHLSDRLSRRATPAVLNMPQSTVPPPANSEQPGTAPGDDVTYQYAVRIGIHGQVGRLTGGARPYRRGTQVICRTARGLEVGQVLSALEWSVGDKRHNRSQSLGSAAEGLEQTPSGAEQFDGRIVRAMAAEDQLLWNHLKQLAEDAHAACQAWLSDSGLPDRLLDVEPLLDGRTLYFHFLDSVSNETTEQIEQLVDIFQRTVADSSFARLLDHGCGPGCGTEQAKGCGSACASCTVRCRS